MSRLLCGVESSREGNSSWKGLPVAIKILSYRLWNIGWKVLRGQSGRTVAVEESIVNSALLDFRRIPVLPQTSRHTSGKKTGVCITMKILPHFAHWWHDSDFRSTFNFVIFAIEAMGHADRHRTFFLLSIFIIISMENSACYNWN
jgi:hypothetical protein